MNLVKQWAILSSWHKNGNDEIGENVSNGPNGHNNTDSNDEHNGSYVLTSSETDLSNVTSDQVSCDSKFPVELVSIPGSGRGLRSMQDIAGGQVVFEDRPLVVGPSERTDANICCGCFYNRSSVDCQRCWLRLISLDEGKRNNLASRKEYHVNGTVMSCHRNFPIYIFSPISRLVNTGSAAIFACSITTVLKNVIE